MLGRRLLNSANAGQCAEFSEYAGLIPAEISECWAEEVKKYLAEKRGLVTWIPYD